MRGERGRAGERGEGEGRRDKREWVVSRGGEGEREEGRGERW